MHFYSGVLFTVGTIQPITTVPTTPAKIPMMRMVFEWMKNEHEMMIMNHMSPIDDSFCCGVIPLFSKIR